VRVASRACAIGCLAAGLVAARPAGAAMTIGLREKSGETRTFYQDGSRVRIVNPSGTNDGEAYVVDLKTSEHVVVYDDAKAYYDLGKSLAQRRAAVEPNQKEHPSDRKKPPAVSYRSLGVARHVAGIACAMYQRLIDGLLDAKVCFAPWGGAVGPREDFLWFDELVERVSTAAGEHSHKRPFHTLAQEEGLVLWVARINADRGLDTMEVVKLSRDPVPFALLHVPSDYKEFSRPLTASEHPKIGPPPMDDRFTWRSLDGKVTAIIVIMMSIAIGLGFVVNALLLHLAASVVIENNRFRQALLATAIIWVVQIPIELLRLPTSFRVAFGAFTAFAGLKIAYGASVGRTIALFVMEAALTASIAYLLHRLFG
jgi:hypothetical protein